MNKRTESFVQLHKQFINTFSVTTFEKTVLLEVRVTGAMTMALRLDVKHKIV